MKTTLRSIFVLIFLSFLSTNINAQQCDIPNGSFEVWEDLTQDFDETGMLPDGTIMLPEGYFAFLRLLVSGLSDLFGSLFGEDLIELAENLFGIIQSPDASDGDFAVRIGGDEFVPFSDLITIFECDGELPGSFSIDLKHVGDCQDTFSLIATFDETTFFPDDEDSYLDASAYFLVENFINNSNTSYETLNVPVVNNLNGISPDSVFMIMIVNGDENCITETNESYFLIDNMQFYPDVVLPLTLTNVVGENNLNHNKISWSVSSEIDVSHYELERSLLNTNLFESIESLQTNSSSTPSNYVIRDYKLAQLGEYYYRIKQIKNDGSIRYSQIIKIEVNQIYGNGKDVVLYPNPATDAINIKLSSFSMDKVFEYSIVGNDGRLIENSNALLSSYQPQLGMCRLEIQTLPPGIYTIIIGSGSESSKHRFIKN